MGMVFGIIQIIQFNQSLKQCLRHHFGISGNGNTLRTPSQSFFLPLRDNADTFGKHFYKYIDNVFYLKVKIRLENVCYKRF